MQNLPENEEFDDDDDIDLTPDITDEQRAWFKAEVTLDFMINEGYLDEDHLPRMKAILDYDNHQTIASSAVEKRYYMRYAHTTGKEYFEDAPPAVNCPYCKKTHNEMRVGENNTCRGCKRVFLVTPMVER